MAFLGLHVLLPVEGKSQNQTIVVDGHPGSQVVARPAIGASVTVHVPNGPKLVGQVDGGNGFAGRRSSDMHFGLGKLGSDAKLRVDIRWRDGTRKDSGNIGYNES